MAILVKGEHLKGELAQAVKTAAEGVLKENSRVVDLDVFLREGKAGDFVVANRPLRNWEIVAISQRGGRSLEIPDEYIGTEQQIMALQWRMRIELATTKKNSQTRA